MDRKELDGRRRNGIGMGWIHRYPFSECFVAIISNKYKKFHPRSLIPR